MKTVVGIILISTRKYKQFVVPLVNQIEELFLPGESKIVFNFTDEHFSVPTNIDFHQILIPPYRFPQATLYRFKCIRDHQEVFVGCSHLFYIDVDMAIVDKVTAHDILVGGGLVVVRHPGFFTNNGWGDSVNPMTSTSYLDPGYRENYVAGGFNGG